MNVVGYADRLSVQPGETIKFMVSCKLPSYRADVVHLIHGDTNPEGPGFKERLIRTTVSREYAGREQAINNGSYILVPDHPLLNQTASITLQGWVYPTTLDKGTQAIITKWSADDGMGYGLFVEDWHCGLATKAVKLTNCAQGPRCTAGDGTLSRECTMPKGKESSFIKNL